MWNILWKIFFNILIFWIYLWCSKQILYEICALSSNQVLWLLYLLVSKHLHIHNNIKFEPLQWRLWKIFYLNVFLMIWDILWILSFTLVIYILIGFFYMYSISQSHFIFWDEILMQKMCFKVCIIGFQQVQIFMTT